MKIRSTLIAATIASATMLAGCQNGSLGDTLLSAVTVSDAEVKSLSDQSCKEMDSGKNCWQKQQIHQAPEQDL